MNTRAKGNKARREVIAYYKRNGGDAAICERTGKFIKEKDLFGLFDLVAYDSLGDVWFIQVTCNKPHSHKKHQEFANKDLVAGVLQYVRMDGGKYNFYRYYSDGTRATYKNITLE